MQSTGSANVHQPNIAKRTGSCCEFKCSLTNLKNNGCSNSRKLNQKKIKSNQNCDREVKGGFTLKGSMSSNALPKGSLKVLCSILLIWMDQETDDDNSYLIVMQFWRYLDANTWCSGGSPQWCSQMTSVDRLKGSLEYFSWDFHTWIVKQRLYHWKHISRSRIWRLLEILWLQFLRRWKHKEIYILEGLREIFWWRFIFCQRYRFVHVFTDKDICAEIIFEDVTT